MIKREKKSYLSPHRSGKRKYRQRQQINTNFACMAILWMEHLPLWSWKEGSTRAPTSPLPPLPSPRLLIISRNDENEKEIVKMEP